MYRVAAATALACLLAAGCASSRVDDPVQSARITLEPGAQAQLSSTVKLRFDRIADNRCPRNVQCVWAGTVAYHFTLSGVNGTESFKLEAGASFDSSTFKPVRVSLDGATPGPVQAMGQPTLPHAVDIGISLHEKGPP